MRVPRGARHGESVSIALIGGLVGLALVDSTSIGTLVVPIWLLLAPQRPPVRKLAGYLVSIAAFYFVVGVALLAVAGAGLSWLRDAARSPVIAIPQLIVGIALFALSFRFDSRKRRARGEPPRTERWRARALAAQSSQRGLAVLAVTAGTIEVFSMLPYLAAIGLLVSNRLPAVEAVPLLAGYCLVMVVPAALILAARAALHTRIDGPLTALDAFLTRHADSAAGWVLGIVGFLLARDAAAVLLG